MQSFKGNPTIKLYLIQSTLAFSPARLDALSRCQRLLDLPAASTRAVHDPVPADGPGLAMANQIQPVRHHHHAAMPAELRITHSSDSTQAMGGLVAFRFCRDVVL